MRSKKVTILYDGEEDRWYDEAKQKEGEDVDPPVHIPLGEALEKLGHKVKRLKVEKDALQLAQDLSADKSDIVFNVCDGIAGETAKAVHVASLLELLGKKFTGSGSEAMAISQDKVLTKQLFSQYGIPTPRFAVLDRAHLEWADQLEFPLIVKPANEDASIGITEGAVVSDVRSLLERVSFIHTEVGRPALIEEYVDGRELYAVVFGNAEPQVLPLLEWPLTGGASGFKVASFEAKWDKNHPDYQEVSDYFAKDLPRAVVDKIERAAVKAFRALRLQDYARIDIRLAEDGTPYFLEVNPNPFLDPRAEVAMAAQNKGLDYGELGEWIMQLALDRYRPAPKALPDTTGTPKRARRARTPTKKKTKASGGTGTGATPKPHPTGGEDAAS
jgi:D-alanine-D-alanine ligase